MLSGSARVARQSTPVTLPPTSASPARRVDASSTNLTLKARGSRRTRDATVTQAGFFDTIFSGGSSGSSKQGDELTAKLFDLIKRRGNKTLFGPNKQIDELIAELQKVNTNRNPTRSPLFPGAYKVAYLEDKGIPADAEDPMVTFMENLDTIQSYVRKDFGLLPVVSKRFGKAKIVSSDTYIVSANDVERKGLFGVENLQLFAETRYNILYLDEKFMIVRGRQVGSKASTTPPAQVYERTLAPVQKGLETKGTVKIGSPVGNVVPKATPAQKARPSPKKSTPVASNGRNAAKAAAEKAARERELRLQREKAAAEKAAREREIRLQREKAAAEREASEKLRAQIKDSMDGFNQRLKEAQENKREAAAELRDFERKNSGVMKELTAFKKQMDAFDSEIAALVTESEAVAEEQKTISQELRDCRQELTSLQRKLAPY